MARKRGKRWQKRPNGPRLAQPLPCAEGKMRVKLGDRVKIRDEFDKTVIFRFVISGSHDPLKGKISVDSPWGKAIVNQCEDDEVKIETPGGLITVKILKIFPRRQSPAQN